MHSLFNLVSYHEVLLSRTWHIVIAYLDEHIDAKETQQHILELGRDCILVPGDLSKKEMAVEVVRRALNRFGQIDILVNNAARSNGSDM